MRRMSNTLHGGATEGNPAKSGTDDAWWIRVPWIYLIIRMFHDILVTEAPPSRAVPARHGQTDKLVRVICH